MNNPECIIQLTVEGQIVEIPCKDISDYSIKIALLNEHFPHLDWKEKRVPGE